MSSAFLRFALEGVKELSEIRQVDFFIFNAVFILKEHKSVLSNDFKENYSGTNCAPFLNAAVKLPKP